MYTKAIFTHKALNKQTPEYESKLLKPVSQTHGLNLRSSQNGDIHVPMARASLYSGALSTCQDAAKYSSFLIGWYRRVCVFWGH